VPSCPVLLLGVLCVHYKQTNDDDDNDDDDIRQETHPSLR